MIEFSDKKTIHNNISKLRAKETSEYSYRPRLKLPQIFTNHPVVLQKWSSLLIGVTRASYGLMSMKILKCNYPFEIRQKQQPRPHSTTSQLAGFHSTTSVPGTIFTAHFPIFFLDVMIIPLPMQLSFFFIYLLLFE